LAAAGLANAAYSKGAIMNRRSDRPSNDSPLLRTSRRGAIGALSIGAAVTAMPAAAFSIAALPASLNEFVGFYPVADGVSIEGFFAAPVGGRKLDVVLLAPEVDADAEVVLAEARRLSQSGAFVVIPKLTADPVERDAELARITPLLGAMAHSNGTVRVVGI
jgi:hypothetical protein